MKKFLTVLFVTLGVIFFLVILAVVLFFAFDPLGIRSSMLDVQTEVRESTSSTSAAEDKNPLLTPTQEKALETIGVNPAELPSEITPEMEECFADKLGEERVSEIKAGDTPSAFEYFKARGCVQ